ncbi:MAG: FHA domain-containing protein [Myxococcota bacterium]
MAGSVPFLELTEEFGGTKFGPFESVEIRLGSDRGRNDISLPDKLGVAPQHAKLLRQDDASFILAPVDRDAPIYLYARNDGPARLVTGPTALRSGDAFSLVKPEGVRFVLMLERDPKAVADAKAAAEGGDRAKRTFNGVWDEIRRRGLASVFSTALGNRLQTLWQLVRSGSLFSPVYIVTGMAIVSGWLLAGGSGVAAVRTNWRANYLTDELSECQARVERLKGSQNLDGDPTVPSLAGTILGNEDAWAKTLQNDSALLASYADQLKTVYAQQDRFAWTFEDDKSVYAKLKQDLELQNLPLDVVRVLAFAAAHPGRRPQWTMFPDSEDTEVCGRGPLDLTYRMAVALGLDAKPDALVVSQLAQSSELTEKRQALEQTITLAGTQFEIRDDLIVSAPVAKGMSCLYIDGNDARTEPAKVAEALVRLMGAGAAGVPSANDDYWIAARLYLLDAQDFRAKIDGLDRNSAPSIQMGTLQVLDSRSSFATKSVARLMARASVVPCLARARGGEAEVPKWFLTRSPSLSSCGILQMYIGVNRL